MTSLLIVGQDVLAGFLSFKEEVFLFFGERAEFADFKVAEDEGADADAVERDDIEACFLDEEADFSFFSFVDADGEGPAADFFHVCWFHPGIFHEATFGDGDEVVVGDFLGGFDEIFFGLPFGGMDDVLGKVAVVRNDEKACGVAVKAADGEEAVREVGEKIDN